MRVHEEMFLSGKTSMVIMQQKKNNPSIAKNLLSFKKFLRNICTFCLFHISNTHTRVIAVAIIIPYKEVKVRKASDSINLIGFSSLVPYKYVLNNRANVSIE